MIYKKGNTYFDSVTLQLSVGKVIQDVASAVPPVPAPSLKAVQAVVTRRCNLSCSYCNVMLSGDSQDDMSEETADLVIKSAREAPKGRLVMVTGGEPLLVPDTTFRILENVSSPKVLFTNATLITRSIASELKRMNVSPVVSLDGSEEIHNVNRCGSWAAAAAGLDLLREAGVEYGISTVVGHHNCSDIGFEMQKLIDRFQPSSMGFNILHWTKGSFNPVSADDYMNAMGEIFRIALETGTFVDQIARRIDPIITGVYRHRDCAALGGKIVYHPDGKTSNCISGRGVEDWFCWIPAHLEFCEDCPAAGICGGGCPWDAIHLGENDKPDPRHCTWVKRILDMFLQDVEAHFPPGLVSRSDLRVRYGALVTRGAATLAGSLGH